MNWSSEKIIQVPNRNLKYLSYKKIKNNKLFFIWPNPVNKKWNMLLNNETFTSTKNLLTIIKRNASTSTKDLLTIVYCKKQGVIDHYGSIL